jgi:hypothetical protein
MENIRATRNVTDTLGDVQRALATPNTVLRLAVAETGIVRFTRPDWPRS